MRISRLLRITAMCSILAVPLVLSGCGLFGAGPAAQIDPPPSDIETQMLQSLESSDQTSLELEESLSTVYLQDEQGWLAPVSLHLPSGEAQSRVGRQLEMLVKDSPYQALIPSGFSGVLPAGTQVEAVTIKEDEKLAMVEFNQAFGGYDAVDERKIMEAVTWTLLGNEGVEKVQIWMAGAKLNEMPVGKTPMDRPLTRALGINLELGEGMSFSQTRPVTLYFAATNPDGAPYYVPVTRFVSTGKNAVTAALGELIEGPVKGNGLESVLTGGTVLKAVELSEDGVITVSLEDDMFEAGDKPPAQMLQSLVLTVTENAQNYKVRVWLNGQKNVVGMDNQQYGEPVLRPANINEIKL